jgi:hypothetical protein
MKIRLGVGVLAVMCGALALTGAAGAQKLSGAQEVAGAVPGLTGACGAGDVKFEVKSEYDNKYAPAAEAGKALVYLIQDDRLFVSKPRPTTRWGIDGAWVGATQSNAYFAVTVAPGEHHLCAEWEGSDSAVSLTHFTAEAGKTYYFRATDVGGPAVSVASVWLGAVDADEGALMAARLRVSVATPRK